ncbi:MAG: hypothetical protein R3F55_07440 [Alphaproteobacteria bacterium]
MRTRYLDMTLDHASGALDGTVIAGRFQGTALSDLSPADLRQLLDEVTGDAQSKQVLEAYLDRVHGPGWRAGGADGRADRAASGTARMTLEEAREVLGVGAEASRDEIEAAYRAAIRRNHPDAGGSSWLAAKINEARELLLG